MEQTRRILRQLGTIYRKINTKNDTLFRQVGLEKGQYQYVVRIAEQPGLLLHELAEVLSVDKSATSKGIRKLQQKGLVAVQEDPADARKKRLHLTLAGKEVFTYIRLQEEVVEKTVLSGLSAPQLNTLETYLTTLINNCS